MSTPEEPHRDSEEPRLLPQSTSLIVMLSLFLLVGIIALLSSISRGERAAVEPGGRRAFGPADFKADIDWDNSLYRDILATAKGSADEAGFAVPRPPLSDNIYPCTEYAIPAAEVDLKPRKLEDAHDEIELHHGPKDRWCFDCHNANDRDKLRLANGTLIGFDETYRLCGQCHGTIFRDWRLGIHGRRVGYWNGAKTYLLCVHCHNPHQPRFKAIKPLPPPVRPQFLAAGRPTAKETK